MATIVLTGGGTAGHCVPHLALLPYLKNDFDKIYYIGSEHGMEKDIIEKENIPYFSVPCAKLVRKFTVSNMSIPFKVLDGIKKAGKFLDELKPDVVFSKGGYVSVPTVIASKKRGIPVIAHESDYTVGLANKLTSKYCKKVLTSFPETAEMIPNGEYVGSPIRNSLLSGSKTRALSTFGFSGKKPVLLCMGGSQGSEVINRTLREALDVLCEKYDVIHICGKGNVDDKINKKGYFQAEYLNKIENAFAVASVCVSRSGSNSVFELMCLKIPCVLIPLPKGISRGDQVLNANYFEKLGEALVLNQDALTKESLILKINSAYLSRNLIVKNLTERPVKNKSREISRILADYILS